MSNLGLSTISLTYHCVLHATAQKITSEAPTMISFQHQTSQLISNNYANIIMTLMILLSIHLMSSCVVICRIITTVPMQLTTMHTFNASNSINIIYRHSHSTSSKSKGCNDHVRVVFMRLAPMRLMLTD